MSYTTIAVSQEFEMKRAKLFALSQDHTLRLQWDSYLTAIELLENAQRVGLGVKVMTKTLDGLSMQTVYTAYIEQSLIEVVMTSHSAIFKEFIGQWIYEDMDANTCTLTISYRYKLRFPYVLLKPWVSQKLKRTNQSRLLMLKNFAESRGGL